MCVCVWKAAYNREMPVRLDAFLPGRAALHCPQPVEKGRTGRHTQLECCRTGCQA